MSGDRRAAATGVLVGALVLASAAGARAAGITDSQSARLDSLIEAVRVEHLVPGLAVAVVRGEEIVTARAVGTREAGDTTAVQPDDRFHLGSVSKPMTATMIASLVETGVLHWSTTVLEAFPEREDQIHEDLRSVTVEMLLRHLGGIQDFEEDEEFEEVPRFSGSPMAKRQAFTRWLLEREPALPPGSEHRYSNAGYTIAASIAERFTGQSWETLMREHVFRPLGMTTGGFGWPARSVPASPWGHLREEEKIVLHDPFDDYRLEDQFIGPAGDVHASVVDLARFLRAHLGGLRGARTILEAETVRHLHAAPEDEYALGWNVRSFGDHHLGSAGTFFSVVLVSPEDDLAYAVVANVDTEPEFASAMLSGLRRIFRAPPEPPAGS